MFRCASILNIGSTYAKGLLCKSIAFNSCTKFITKSSILDEKVLGTILQILMTKFVDTQSPFIAKKLKSNHSETHEYSEIIWHHTRRFSIAKVTCSK